MFSCQQLSIATLLSWLKLNLTFCISFNLYGAANSSLRVPTKHKSTETWNDLQHSILARKKCEASFE